MSDINKEKIYDEQINPLVAQIIKICLDNGIAMIFSCELPSEEDEGLCCSTVMPDESGINSIRHSRCARILLQEEVGHISAIVTVTDKNGNKTSSFANS